MKGKKIRETKEQLRWKLKAAEAQQVHNLHFADSYLAGMKGFEGSAVILQIHSLSGKELIPATAIVNGLSPATIAAIRADLTRSWLYKTELMPEGARE